MTSPKPDPTPDLAAAPAPTVAVIDPANTEAPPYAMFELGQLSAAGAFLIGSVFFERGEEFLVQLRQGTVAPIRVRARVVEHTRTPDPGMTIEFINLTDAERSALSALSAAGD
ncbi:MAG TPA: PilZ domain-containing protein [Kofleriaceae bacterium]|nr:PilZ domain-containing protein [Kofleriaceae bacterium]